MRAIVVRHYRTESNAHHLIMGWGDAPPADNWEVDLAYVDRLLRRRQIAFDAVYSSALGRAQHTACYYGEKRGIPLARVEPGLNEIDYGCLRGHCKEWVADHYPQYKNDPDYVYPDGESFRQMQQRSVSALLGIAEQHPDHTLLIVAHAGVIRGLVCHFLGLDLGDHLKVKISHRYIGDFRLREGVCDYYDELGNRSGFAREGGVALPWRRGETAFAPATQTSTPRPSASVGSLAAELLQPA